MQWSDTGKADTALLYAALFLYLNRHCFNGIYRVNQMVIITSRLGNMPHLTFRLTKCAALPKRPTTQKPFSLMAIFATPSLTLCSWHMTRLFTATPYIPASKTANFTAYGKPFTLDDHRDLVATLLDAHRQHGTRSVISNSDTPETREIYSAFNLHAFSVRRSVSAKSRDMAGEVIGVLRRWVDCWRAVGLA
jgi:DNA adenine methylase